MTFNPPKTPNCLPPRRVAHPKYLRKWGCPVLAPLGRDRAASRKTPASASAQKSSLESADYFARWRTIQIDLPMNGSAQTAGSRPRPPDWTASRGAHELFELVSP